MTNFLSELSGRLADRWISVLVMPGLLFVTAIAAALRLGQPDAVSVTALSRAADAASQSSEAHSGGGLALIAAGVLAASAAAGLAGTLAGHGVERFWVTPGLRRPAGLLVAWRRRRWTRAESREAAGIRKAALSIYPPTGRQGPGTAARPSTPAVPKLPAYADSAIARRERIGLVRPERPTWIGDRLLLTERRIGTAYELDLASAWPALWLVVPDSARQEVGTAQDAYSTAARLTGWGLLYVIVGAWWWPAAVIGLATSVTGWLRGRQAADVLAQLIEAVVDLYSAALAKQLGVADTDRLDASLGAAITTQLRKRP
ncbi:hypothetical protein [Catenulispora rubra]|uniref:hypothetical protein n=1 Tax=Catenulispora rubra TaxID=280293 RepID=UPI00189247C3|nr:hypothetical protein [Catenulispora rubra]